MSVVLELSQTEVDRLRRYADSCGVVIEQYLTSLVHGLISNSPVAQAVALYDARLITQGQAAALAGLSRSDFIDTLSRACSSPFQYEDADELIEEALRV